MITTDELLNVLEAFIDAKIACEFASREEGADGYRSTPTQERHVVNKIKIDLYNLIYQIKQENGNQH
jgi:hypothetical protein